MTDEDPIPPDDDDTVPCEPELPEAEPGPEGVAKSEDCGPDA